MKKILSVMFLTTVLVFVASQTSFAASAHIGTYKYTGPGTPYTYNVYVETDTVSKSRDYQYGGYIYGCRIKIISGSNTVIDDLQFQKQNGDWVYCTSRKLVGYASSVDYMRDIVNYLTSHY